MLTHTKKGKALPLLRAALGTTKQKLAFIPHSDICPHCKNGTLIPIMEFQPIIQHFQFWSSG
jgi:hypothetical protein